MATSGRIIFLAGAPEAESLNWDEHSLLSDFEAPLARFLDGSWKVATSRGSFGTTTSFPSAKWRFLDYNGPGQENLPAHESRVSPTQFLSFTNDACEEGPENSQLEFFDHSAAVLEGIDSSQILPTTAEHNEDMDRDIQTTFISNATTTSTTDSSFRTSMSSNPDPSPPKASSANISCAIADLKRIPNAEHVTRIQPQTITLNLVVGIISISPPRTVQLRRSNSAMDIIELTVGDETRAGFSTSFWLVPGESQHRRPSDDLREMLRRLRTGDVVLLRNVALSCFRGCVYGQSLSRRFARNSTSVVVLEDCGHRDQDGAFAAKVRRVRDWTRDFVGVAKTRMSGVENVGRGGRKRKLDELPPDTQD